MSVSVPYTIDLLSLKGLAARREYTLGDDFFTGIENSEIDGGQVEAVAVVTPVGDNFQLDMEVKGTVSVPCDRCLDPMSIDIEASDSIKVVLGSEDDDDGETVTVDERNGLLDVAWHLYELVALQLPIMHVHPEGQCNEAMARVLEEHRVSQADEEEE